METQEQEVSLIFSILDLINVNYLIMVTFIGKLICKFLKLYKELYITTELIVVITELLEMKFNF